MQQQQEGQQRQLILEILESSVANSLAKKILNLDPSVISVDVISNNGTVLGGATKQQSHVQAHVQNTDDHSSRRAFRAAMIMGSIKADDKFASEIESVILVRKNTKSLLIWVPRYACILAILFEKETFGKELGDRIRERLEID